MNTCLGINEMFSHVRNSLLWCGISWLSRAISISYTGQDGIEKSGVEIVLEKLEMLDAMPTDVWDTLEAKDAANGAQCQQP